MVKAILSGRETTTRRIIKVDNNLDFIGASSSKCNDMFDMASFGKLDKENIENSNIEKRIKTLYLPEDILYVRETWLAHPYKHRKLNITYKADREVREVDFSEERFEKIKKFANNKSFYFQPSLFMPKEAARIFLKVIDVRVERLQNMTEEDFWDEGVEIGDLDFKNLWNSTIKRKDKEKYSWEANPYVWVIKFKRINIQNNLLEK